MTSVQNRKKTLWLRLAALLLPFLLSVLPSLANSAAESPLPPTAATGEQSSATSSEKPQGPACKILVVNPHSAAEPDSAKPEAPQVIEILQKLTKAYTEGDLATYENFLDDECSSFDEKSHKMIEGKPAIIAHLKSVFATHAQGGNQPLVSYEIDEPYVKVSGAMAVATYLAIRQTGGENPKKTTRLTTNVFVKQGGEWKLTHDSGEWKAAPKH